MRCGMAQGQVAVRRVVQKDYPNGVYQDDPPPYPGGPLTSQVWGL